MKYTLLLLFALGCFKSNAQDSLAIATEAACNCLYAVSTSCKDKISYQREYNNCLQTYFSRAKLIDKTIVANKDLSSLIQYNLYNNCDHIEYIDSIMAYYTSITQSNFIISTEDCKSFKDGIFMGEGDSDSTIIVMSDSIQILKFNDGSYTKSEVIWLGPCSYKLNRIESTNDFEKEYLNAEIETLIRIIGVEKKTITYEMVIGDSVFMGRLIRLK